MTLIELCDTLPNGLHDAEVSIVSIDYLHREATFTIDVWVGDVSSKDEDVREAYRSGELKLTGLLYCAMESPDANYPYGEARHLRIDAGDLGSASSTPSMKLPEPLPDGAFASWFFVQGWNAFIYLAAHGATLEWAE